MPCARTSMTEDQRESAIRTLADLAEVFYAEYRCFEALYARTSCLSHKGDADRARLNAQKAAELMAALVLGRSAAKVAQMEQERGLA